MVVIWEIFLKLFYRNKFYFNAINFGKKLIPALVVTGITIKSSHLINKSLNKKKGGNIRIDLPPSNVKKINNILKKL